MVSWKNIVLEAKKEAQNYYSQHGIAPTLRGLFYILVSKNVIPNTINYYRTLSSVLAKERYVGNFPWYLIRDETRTFRWGEVGYSIVDAEKVVDELKNMKPEDKERILKEYLKNKYRVKINKWEGQKYSVLVIVEKEAQYDAVEKVVNSDLKWSVATTTSRGFESATALNHLVSWIEHVKKQERVPVLLFIFDWDPSGEYASIYDFIFRLCLLMYRDDREEIMDRWSKSKIDEKEQIIKDLVKDVGIVFEKVMLTWEQVKKYNLPPEPQDQETKRKLERDPRARMFLEKYGFLGQVEVDAMFALYYDEAKKIVDEAVKRYFDFNKYQEVVKKEEELKKKVFDLLGG
ncbi:MAG: hypothetical protein QXT86_12545 [Archaeoglobaceae archaeon]